MGGFAAAEPTEAPVARKRPAAVQSLPASASVAAADADLGAAPRVAALSALGGRLSAAAPALQLQRVSASPAAAQASVIQRALVRDSDILGQKGATYRWADFRSAPQGANDGTATDEGRGATLTAGSAAKSKIKWGAVDGGSGEGTGLTATIGPDHKLGSSPSAAVAVARVAALRWLSGKSYISGHLLTEKLGGPGTDSRNLTAIPASANTLQSANIEERLRVPVNEEGRWMHFEIAVSYANDTKKVAQNTAALPAAQGVQLTAPQTVTARYASRLDASWHILDVNGGAATPTTSVSITMDSPLAGAGAAPSKPATSGAASGAAEARTSIDAEELVLTTSNLLKHVVDNRKPLIGRIEELRANIEELDATVEEKRAAHERLNAEAQKVGQHFGYRHGYNHTLADNRLADREPDPPMIGDPAYVEAFKTAYAGGVQDATAYSNGYWDGYNAGWSDEGAPFGAANGEYQTGFNRGHGDGLAQGDYSAGKRYNIDQGTLLENIHEARQNVHATRLGFISVDLTGERHRDGNTKWYQVELKSAVAPSLEDHIGRFFWVKRAWLRKAY